MMKKIVLLSIVAIFFVGMFLSKSKDAYAYGECSEYGFMATYDSLRNTCECMSGYIMGRGVLGKTECISADSMCRDEYGFSSRYDSLSDSCKCSYGYILGKDSIGRTQCISESTYCTSKLGISSRYNTLTDSCECSYGYILGKDSIGRTQCISQDSYCQNELGYNSTYDVLSDACECRFGYVINGGKCENGTSVCHSKHGIYSSYSDLQNKCECDTDYTLDESGQCVEKQNNVYFSLEELDTENQQAIIRSDYDYRYHLISYGIGCYDSSFERYLNRQIVVNLGTDFNLDLFDKIVLQDDDQVCDITHIEYADSDTTLEPEETESTFSFFGNNTSRLNLTRNEGESNEDQDARLDPDVAADSDNEEQQNDDLKGGESWYARAKHFLCGLLR